MVRMILWESFTHECHVFRSELITARARQLTLCNYTEKQRYAHVPSVSAHTSRHCKVNGMVWYEASKLQEGWKKWQINTCVKNLLFASWSSSSSSSNSAAEVLFVMCQLRSSLLDSKNRSVHGRQSSAYDSLLMPFPYNGTLQRYVWIKGSRPPAACQDVSPPSAVRLFCLLTLVENLPQHSRVQDMPENSTWLGCSYSFCQAHRAEAGSAHQGYLAKKVRETYLIDKSSKTYYNKTA